MKHRWIEPHFIEGPRILEIGDPRHLQSSGQVGDWACGAVRNQLADHGIPVMNQSVLLRGVNDRPETLEALFRGLVRMRVRPYYLLQTDPVIGTSHLRTPLSAGIAIMEALQGRLSGIALPKLIVDTPHGKGKVPVGPQYIVRQAPGVTTLITAFNVTDWP